MVESTNTTYMTGDSMDRKVAGFFLLGVVFLSIESAQLVGFDTTHLKVKMPTNEIVCPDDSLWFWPMPYYSFRQYYDSCYIDCSIGETRIYRQNGGSDRIAPCEYFFHVDSPTPKCFDTYDNLFDSSRTEYFSLNQGDTLRYYKSLSLVRRYMSTEYFGCSDTIFFLTQLLDSVSGDAIATIDTMAVIIADSLRTSAFYHCSTYTPTVGNVWSYVRPTVWSHDRVALSVSIDFRKAPGTEDILCRWDLFSDALFSGEDVYQFQTLCAIYDSIEAGGMGKIRY